MEPFRLETTVAVPVGVPEYPEAAATLTVSVVDAPAASVVGLTVREVVEASQGVEGVVKVPFEEYQPLTPDEGLLR